MPGKKGKFNKQRGGAHHGGHKNVKGAFRVDNFPGTMAQLKTWVFGMYSQYKGDMKFKDNGDHFVIEYFKDFLAEKLIQLNGAIHGGVQVIVSPLTVSKPTTSLADIIQRICTMGYNRENSHMDLSHLAEKLANEGYAKSFDIPIQTKVIDYIKAHYPTTNSIDYSYNKLGNLHIFSKIYEAMPQLVGLNLSFNNIKSLDQLEIIKDIPLEVLSLNENPILNESGFKLFVLFFLLY